jgi:Zn-dependent protease
MDIQKIAILAPPLLFSLTCHEVAHAWVAEKLGDPTARRLGRITLNPLKHLDPIGTLVFIMTQMIGWAKPVPIYPGNFSKPRQMMAIVALAGPMMNIALALASALLYHYILPIADGIGAQAPDSLAFTILNPLTLMIQMSVILNVSLAVFNVIPINPLDGGRILAGLLPQGMAEKFNRVEGFGFIIVIALIASGALRVTIFPIIWKILDILLG